jgi:HPt (histidine-containing phosphotransfer) domain-containing protein
MSIARIPASIDRIAEAKRPVERHRRRDSIGRRMRDEIESGRRSKRIAPAPAGDLVAAEVLQDFWHSVGEAAFDRLVDTYFEEMRARLESLPAEMAAQRLDHIERLAHDLKTCAAALGGLMLRDCAAALEQASREGDEEATRTIVADIASLGRDTLAAVDALRRTLPRS